MTIRDDAQDADGDTAAPATGDDPMLDAGLQALFEEGAMRDEPARAALLARAGSPARAARLAALFAAHDRLPPEPPRVAPEEPDPARLIGRRLGGFTVSTLLATGGTSHVFIARQDSPSREIVLKVRRARHGTDGQIRRFLAEAERLAAFVHPGVAHVYGSGVEQAEDGAVAWIAMEKIDGDSLADWRNAATRSLRERCEMLAEIAKIVAAAHAAGVVHRDVAPRNVTIDRGGRPRVLDFGIARTLHSIDSHPSIEGTPGFASPEQCAGLPASPADDVHGLGRMLAWLVPDAPPALAALRDAATGAPEGRPTAERFAHALRRAVARPRWPAVVVGLVALAVVALASSLAVSACESRRAAAQDAEVQSVMQAVLASAASIEDRGNAAAAAASIRGAQERILAATGASAAVRWRALEQLSTAWRDLGRYAESSEAADLAAAVADSDPRAPRLVAPRLRAFAAVQAAMSDDAARADRLIDRSAAELDALAPQVGDGATPPAAGDVAAEETLTNDAQALKHLALAAKLRDRLELAARLTERAGPFFRTGVLAGTRAAVVYFINAARLEQLRGRMDAAVALAETAVEASRTAEAGNEIAQLSTRALQAGVLEEAGQPAKAAPIYAEQLEVWTRIGGPLHPKTITALNNLGLNALRQGQPQRAVELLQDTCRRAIEAQGERHAHTIDDHGNLVLALQACGRRDEALAVLDRFLPILRETRGSPCADECAWLRLRAGVLEGLGRRDEAEAALRQAVDRAMGLTDDGAQLRAAREALGKLEKRPPME
jgi:tRNA A-37 threonylcarbamoyl transferase component Bud32/tetratricopeptide (TPR) repeat protein